MHSILLEDIKLIRDSDLFDSDWYLSQYIDVAKLGMDPAEHYLWLGGRIGRNPSPRFCSESYLSDNPDVLKSGQNPLLHYLRVGIEENKLIYSVRSAPSKRSIKKVKRNIVRRLIDWNDQLSLVIETSLDEHGHIYHDDLVSIIMPARDREASIGAAIESVIAQTHRNFELIVIDDGSSDKTRETVERFNDPRVKYLYNAGVHGVSRARNIGLDHATGAWAFFLDSDNKWSPRMVEIMLKHAAANAVSAGYCAADVRNEEGQRKSVLYADFDFESLLSENFIDLNCFFMRRDGDFDEFRFNEAIRRLVDWDFILRVGARTRISGIPYLGVYYYDGASDRISNKEYVGQGHLEPLIREIRTRGRNEILYATTIRDYSSYRIAIVWHVFHAELVPECIKYLENADFDYDLYVTTSLNDESEVIRTIRNWKPDARVFNYPNHGADLAPFLELVSTLKNYFIVGKIHTKRDVGNWGDAWRKLLFNSVLGSKEYVSEVIRLFKSNENLALVGSRELFKLGMENSIPETREYVTMLAKAMGMEEHLGKDWSFIAGTMFWVRPGSLVRMARYMCDSPGYSAIYRQDGALEHGLERMLGAALWMQPHAQVGLYHRSGAFSIHPLGEGHSTDGITQTLTSVTQ